MKKKIFSFMFLLFCFDFFVYAESNDEELVLLDLPKEGVHFPIGPFDDGKEPEFGKYHDETGKKIITEGFLNKSYYIGKYEVTYRLWKKVHDWATTGAGKNKGYVFNKGKAGFALKEKDEENLNEKHPVTNVNWYDCIVWCNAHSEMCGAVPVYYKKEIADNNGKVKPENLKDFQKFILRNAKTEKKDCDSLVCLTAKDLGIKNKENGFRLPTWLEWQLAAKLTDKKDFIVTKNGKALQCTVNGKQWFFTKGSAVSGGKYDLQNKTTLKIAIEEAKKYANFGLCLGMGNPTHRVMNQRATLNIGTLIPNSLGIYDMSGNVDEWCLDYYPKTRLTPAGRTAQGGSCCMDLIIMRLGSKGLALASERNKRNSRIHGLRICKTK